MKILHIIPSVDPLTGGTAVGIAGLAIAQRQVGLEVEIFTGPLHHGDASLFEAMKAKEINVRLAPAITLSNRRSFASISELEQCAARADVLHIHGLWEPMQHASSVIARRLGRPYIFSPHGMLDPWSLNQGKWKKRLYLAWRLRKDLNKAAALHFTASKECELTAPLKLRPPAIIEPNGIDAAEFDNLPAKGTFRSKHPQLCDRPIVLFLSRLHPKKGLNILIPAFAQGAPAEAILVLAGPYTDGYRREIESLLSKHKLDGRVVWTGMLRGRERIEAYVDADLFCLPSYQENFGIVVVEALAAGTPVLISDQVNIWQEIVSAGGGGVSTVNIEALAAELNAWLMDADRRIQAGIAGRILAVERYAWQSIAERWQGHYQTIHNDRLIK